MVNATNQNSLLRDTKMVTYTYNNTAVFTCEQNSLLDLVMTSIFTQERVRQTKALKALIAQGKPITLLPVKLSKDILTVLKKA